MSATAEIVADLAAESDALDDLVAGLTPEQWTLPTPAHGWTIAHQIGHLLWTDRVALIACTDADAFTQLLVDAAPVAAGYIDTAAETEAARPQDDVIADWRATRARLAGALCAVPEGTKIPWFGPPMSAASMATARLMETWAHGLDVVDALGVTREPTDRLRHIAHIGVRTRDFAYVVNGRTPPADPFRFELTTPSGEAWNWGPEGATNIVRGPLVDFCELVTQRRHPADLAITTVGDDAADWVTIAQCFAGQPGGGREPSA